jgi:glycosyltransferase involved in cell wall biosynthesis
MRILYTAIDQQVPGTTGGSIHVAAVAQGLAALGHDVHVLTGHGQGEFPAGTVTWHAMRAPLNAPHLRLLRAGAVRHHARLIAPDVIVERYHNFGGEGIAAARRTNAVAALEVNAPVVDYPGSTKRTLDRLLLVEPMRRWRDWQCRSADLIVTPDRATLPDWIEPDRIVELEWGADTDRFTPAARRMGRIARSSGDTVAVFAGAFRAWHGAEHLVAAIARLRREGRGDIKAVLIGAGPELGRVRDLARGIDGILFTGAVPHEQMPEWLASADVGVAPFDVGRHAPLRLGFYWSPLKIFEYMAAGLPVVAPHIDRLARLVTHGENGLLYHGPQDAGIATALVELSDPARRASFGAAARARAVRQFGWDAHCRRLDAAFREALDRRAGGRARAPQSTL